jgi:hypothetical protein
MKEFVFEGLQEEQKSSSRNLKVWFDFVFVPLVIDGCYGYL